MTMAFTNSFTLPPQIKWSVAFVLLFIAFGIGYLLPGPAMRSESHSVVHEKQMLRTRIDTARVTVAVPMKPIAVKSHTSGVAVRPDRRTVYRLDTMLHLDSAGFDTLSIVHLLPDDSFTLHLGLAARVAQVTVPYLAHDTFYSSSDTIRISGGDPRPWYEELLLILASVVGGIMLGRLSH